MMTIHILTATIVVAAALIVVLSILFSWSENV